MPDTASQTSIVNAALARLGATQRITSIDDGSNLANAAREHWHIELFRLLADYPWNFAIVRASLNEASPAPAHGWSHGYALPADCLRWLPPSVEDDDYYCGVLEDGLILTEAEAPLPVRYLSRARAHDWHRWPAHFSAAMSAAMAAAMAEFVTQSQSVADRQADRAEHELRRAKRIDAMESGNRGRTKVSVRSNWAQAASRRYNRHAR